MTKSKKLWPHQKTGDVDMFEIGRRNTERTFRQLGINPALANIFPRLSTPMAARYEDRCRRCGITIVYVAYGGPDLNPKKCSYCEEDVRK